MVCGDSHTSTHGALGALAFGIGSTEVTHVLATQTLWQRKPRTLRIAVDGALAEGVTAKDLILAVIARIGAAGATGHVIEYAGGAVRALSMEGRLTLCNMSLEAGGRAASRTAAPGGDGPLRLGTFPSAASRFLAPLLAAVADDPAGVRLELTESNTATELEALVVRGDLELAFAIGPFAERDLVGVALTEDPYVLLAPAASALARRSTPPTFEELARLPLIASPGCANIAHLETAMELRGLEPVFAVRTDDDRLANALVAEGMGFAIMGRMQVDAHRTDTAVVELGELLAPRSISLAWHPERPLRPLAVRVVDRVVGLAGTPPPPRVAHLAVGLDRR